MLSVTDIDSWTWKLEAFTDYLYSHLRPGLRSLRHFSFFTNAIHIARFQMHHCNRTITAQKVPKSLTIKPILFRLNATHIERCQMHDLNCITIAQEVLWRTSITKFLEG